ncbi:MAG TPA: type IV pilus assembly protein PilM [Acidimicrobiales bacterium]|nr:type IV pilus assembly protein PilM [Acidimicrobiales bacterium]
MAARVVGLDIGSYAVRAVELSVGGGEPVLHRFAQVTLPPGAVRDGEVVDIGAVAAAIRRLWSEGGFKGKKAVVGVANQRVIVRQAELPAMSEADLETALRFEAQELIPIPVEDAILDFQILDDYISGTEEPRMRILLAAAQRDMVRGHLAAVEGGGLGATAIDLIPFALVRAVLGSAAPSLGMDGGAEAIVCIGGDVTNVVVHEQGVPRFVRILLVGGDDITEAIARDLDVELDEAEDLKRRADPSSRDRLVSRAGQVVGDRLAPLVEEIRGSLDYYLAQSQSSPISRVTITGGGSRITGLMERLQSQLGGSVEPARPLAGVRTSETGFSDSELAALEPLLTVPIGLALGGEVQKGVRRISLLPRELAVVREQRQQALAVGGAVAALTALLLVLWVAKGSQVSKEEDKAEEAEQRVLALQAEKASLQDTTTTAADLAQRQAQVQAVLADDVAWTRLLQEVATVIPNDVWLTSFTGQKGAQVNFQARGFDQTSTARWLLRVAELRSLSGLWVPNSTKTGEGSATLVNFTSQANLTPGARSDRAQRLAGGDQ